MRVSLILILALMLSSLTLRHILSLVFHRILAGINGPTELLLLLAGCCIVTTFHVVAWSSISTIVLVITIILAILVHVAHPF